MAAACGQPAVDSAIADGTNPLKDIGIPAATPSCKLDLCRSAAFADTTAKVQSYSASQNIRFLAQSPILHEWPMNVSLVDTATNTLVGKPLMRFASYADEILARLPANNTEFLVTFPELAAGQGTQPWKCTMQWFWFGTNAKQTCESCVDFVAASAAGGNTAAPAATSSAVAAVAIGSVSSGSGFSYRARRFRA